MKRLASHQITRRSHPARRYGAAFGAPALGLALAALAASPAAADCSAGPMTVSTGPGASYTCTRNCVATGGARVIASLTFSGSVTATQCMQECTRTLGCTAVSYQTTVEMRDGVPLIHIACTLYGAGEPTAADYRSPGPGRTAGVCYRDPPSGLLRDPRLQLDTRAIDQDSLRPGGLPKIGVNISPKKP